MPFIPRHVRTRRLPAGGNGRGLAPRPTFEELRKREKRTAEYYREQREAKDREAIAQGKMPPSQISELKDTLHKDPNLRIVVCARLAADIVLTRPDLTPSVEEVALVAGRVAMYRSDEMDKTLARPGDFWDMSPSPFEVADAIERVRHEVDSVMETDNG